ncbi:site-specific integrase [Vibrio brasiliensis]|uniref:site-specific integrase n=1 Tax=Vibrio brasiliensis TaxID=170652 RepID=UPI001EFE98FC|nr:site-specific integrase [Vibrio brasiliensis]MCG9650206.1 site-specific integrase [Vibrio brasiliensis]
MERQHLQHLQQINQYWKDVLSNLMVLNKVNTDKAIGEVAPYIAQLAILPVSKKSVFSDMLWDYNADVPNRSASVTLAKVQLDFSIYKHIPLGVITEIKCLFLFVYLSPKEFGNSKDEIKPNTLIAPFKDGLNFLDFVFSEVERRLGKEYVQLHYSTLSHLSLLDFEDAAKNTTLKLSSEKSPRVSYKVFFGYLNTHKTKEEIGIECDADYESIKSAYEGNHNKSNCKEIEKLPYLETKEFDLALRRASFNVVSFLKAVEEKVNDPVMVKHYETLTSSCEEFLFSKQEVENYGVYRLSKKGYSISQINAIFPNNQLIVPNSNVTLTNAMVVEQFRKKVTSSEPLRIAINKAYYSGLWVIASLMGARPNVLSDLKIDGCLDLEDNTIVSEEHKGRDNRWNLFNDRWIAIPIMIDAMKVIELIGGKIFRNTYVFANVDTLKPDETNSPMTSLINTVQNSFFALTGTHPHNIPSKLNGYVFRHSLAHQMYRADVGLPVISYQLKHIVSATDALARKGKVSQTTLGYGGIASQLTSLNGQSKLLDLRHAAELEAVKVNFDPNGKYMGGKADEHLSKIKKFFNGCMEAGYSEEEIYEAMVEQGVAIISVGSGYCFGGVEDFDETLPCIGGLRCNPARCHNAVVTKANAPKWREIYLDNIKLVGAEGYEDRQDQIIEAIEETKRVLEYLGEELI